MTSVDFKSFADRYALLRERPVVTSASLVDGASGASVLVDVGLAVADVRTSEQSRSFATRVTVGASDVQQPAIEIDGRVLRRAVSPSGALVALIRRDDWSWVADRRMMRVV